MREVLIELISNTALLLALSFIYEISYNVPFKNKHILALFNGFLIGIIGIAVMITSFELAPGHIFDARSILIGVAALIFGPITGITAAVITSIFRICEGGMGTLMGVSVLASSCLLGLVWRKYILRKNSKNRLLPLYLFGLAVHAAMILLMFILPLDRAVETSIES